MTGAGGRGRRTRIREPATHSMNELSIPLNIAVRILNTIVDTVLAATVQPSPGVQQGWGTVRLAQKTGRIAGSHRGIRYWKLE